MSAKAILRNALPPIIWRALRQWTPRQFLSSTEDFVKTADFVRDDVERGATVRMRMNGPFGVLGYDIRPFEDGDTGAQTPRIRRIMSNLRGWLRDTHQGRVDGKRLQAYLNEFTFRANRRFWRGTAVHRVLQGVVHAEDQPRHQTAGAGA